ncbi:receptor kinase-like protein Xa21 [Quercus suber]|uniref:receptor kinase-like protein Xa21 n=1 Tax=Quercus suber TaxID=58331 RepID=UPI000CE1EBEF|nr:receptor kinase-like protein Xa21 [Quercus suber]
MEMKRQGRKSPVAAMSLNLLCSIHFQAILLLFVVLLHVKTLAVFGDSTGTTSYVGGNETDHQALLAFKSKITLDPRNIFSSWNDSNHFCQWEGVTCGRKHRRVTILDLRSRDLVGSLSPYIGNLSFLRQIVLANNTIGDKIPDEVGRLYRLRALMLYNNSFDGEIPANLSHCSNLNFISVARNNLSGSIPKQLASLSMLKSLSFDTNNLMGGIPPFIGNLSSLQLISAADNVLGGHIPDALGQLQSLKYLGLGGNKLSGLVPPSLYNLSSIIVFSLAKNEISGSLPSDLFLTLPRLQWFQIDRNQFTGSLPVSLSNASELELFLIEENNFTGKVSVNFGGLQRLKKLIVDRNNLGSGDADEMDFFQSLANCSNLQILDIRANQFKGTLFNTLGNLSTSLRVFAISQNLIFGEIPPRMGNLVNLTNLLMDGNKLIGTIPSEIGNLHKLQRLVLSDNKLSGRLPITLGNLSLINYLYLDNNRLEGTIPSSIENCQNLLLLNLYQNNLSGTLPKQLFGISSLSISLNLARNFFIGLLPSEIGNLVHLVELDLSENNLSSKIPSSLGSCTSLEYLYMEGNFFQGAIPTYLSSLRGIQVMDLSRNNLSSQIPNFLEKLSLKNLNLSFNDFEGEVPTKGVFANSSAISLIGNSRLCGGISELKFPRCLTKEEKKAKWPLALKVAISMACVILVVTIMSFLLFCRHKSQRKDNSSESSLRQSLLKVSYQGLLKATDGFSSANLIGVGSFGSVYKGILGEDESIVAVKVINIQRQGAPKSFISECEALKNIRHRNLVKIITSCSSVDFHGNDFKALVYEFMPNGSLENWLHMDLETNTRQVDIQNLNLVQRISIAIDVACALDYLHHRCPMPIVHCDLKPSNILFDCDMIAHIGDFGLAKFLLECTNPKQSDSIGIRGTIGYTPPEYGLGCDVSTKGDVYSYGILLLEMITGKRPTNCVFEGGLNLHNYASMALPNRVIEISDPKLLNNCGDTDRTEECLISMVKIGVSCSMELPQERWDIIKALSELYLVRDILHGARI